MNLPTTKTSQGYIGIQDFRGDVIRGFEKAGFIYHSEVCIWKDPVTAMQRTKALGLLHRQVVKDSCMSRMGIPDYVCTFRKPGDNPEPVAGELDYFAGDQSTFRHEGKLSIDIWQRYASPIWTDINPVQHAAISIGERGCRRTAYLPFAVGCYRTLPAIVEQSERYCFDAVYGDRIGSVASGEDGTKGNRD